MKYRSLGKINVEVSALGFGAMRLPKHGDDVDEEKAIELLHAAFNSGVM